MISPFLFDHDTLSILDQRRLPGKEVWSPCKNAGEVAEAIRTLAVRGAPAIGIAAAFGCALAARSGRGELEKASRLLVRARPTAVNLAWAVGRVVESVKDVPDSTLYSSCLLYTSDAADDLLCVDLGGRRSIKKKQSQETLKT